MCLIAHLRPQELWLPLGNRPGEGQCFGVVVELGDEVGLDLLEPVEDGSAGGADGDHPLALLVRRMKVITRRMRGMAMKRMSTMMTRKVSSIRKKRNKVRLNRRSRRLGP